MEQTEPKDFVKIHANFVILLAIHTKKQPLPEPTKPSRLKVSRHRRHSCAALLSNDHNEMLLPACFLNLRRHFPYILTKQLSKHLLLSQGENCTFPDMGIDLILGPGRCARLSGKEPSSQKHPETITPIVTIVSADQPLLAHVNVPDT